MRTGSLYAVCDPRNGQFWRDQQVYVIGHDYESMKSKITQDGITLANRVDDDGGDARFFQPQWTSAAFVQSRVQKLESFACGVFCGTAISAVGTETGREP